MCKRKERVTYTFENIATDIFGSEFVFIFRIIDSFQLLNEYFLFALSEF